jgi:hypothetical protein
LGKHKIRAVEFNMRKRELPDRSGGQLPARLKPLFWDHRFERLTWQADSDLITSRILATGDWTAVRWLRWSLGDNALRDWLKRRRGAGLSSRQLRFWELVLGLPHPDVNAWLADPARQVWEGRRHQ